MGARISKSLSSRYASASDAAEPPETSRVAGQGVASNADPDDVDNNASASAIGTEESTGVGSSITNVTAAALAGQEDLPDDIKMILSSGLHEGDQDATRAAANLASGTQPSSIQDALADIKAKYNMHQPVLDGELERIRREIELKTRLIQMKDLQRQRQIASQARQQQKPGEEVSPEFKVDVKGKGRAVQEDGEEGADSSDSSSSDSDEDHSSSSSEASDSDASSSSSGSSIKTGKQAKEKANGKRQKPQRSGKKALDDVSDVSGDEDTVARPLKPEEISQAAALFASQHEILDPSIPPPPLERIPQEAPIRPIGQVDHVIDNVIVVRADIKAQESVQGQILDEGSLLCLEDRRVLGAIFETFGSVQAPFYSIRLPRGHPLINKSQDEKGAETPEPVQVGVSVYFSPMPDFSGLLFTREIQASQLRGSDASNLYDEEVMGNEIEFSDDEEEAEYKRMIKQQRKDRHSLPNRGDAREAEFEFDDDDAQSVATGNLHDMHEDDEEGAIYERPASSPRNGVARKRTLSDSTADTVQSANKAPRANQRNEQRGRGGRGAGRGNARQAPRGGNRGRGRGGHGLDSSRGRHNASNGPTASARSDYRSFNGQQNGPQQSYPARPSIAHPLPHRPVYHHPDALPYDDPAPLRLRQEQRSISPVRMQHALPARPSHAVEPYDPVSPGGRSNLARGHNTQLSGQGWTPWNSQTGLQPTQSAHNPQSGFPNVPPHQEYQPTNPGNLNGYPAMSAPYNTPFAQHPYPGR